MLTENPLQVILCGKYCSNILSFAQVHGRYFISLRQEIKKQPSIAMLKLKKKKKSRKISQNWLHRTSKNSKIGFVSTETKAKSSMFHWGFFFPYHSLCSYHFWPSVSYNHHYSYFSDVISSFPNPIWSALTAKSWFACFHILGKGVLALSGKDACNIL